MRRVVVLGSSGSGKSTLARQLATLLNVPHIELDALHWEPNWTSTPPDRMRAKIVAAMEAAPHGWTVCGHYSKVADSIWPHADTIIWLDYSLTTVMTRVIKRTWRRCQTG